MPRRSHSWPSALFEGIAALLLLGCTTRPANSVLAVLHGAARSFEFAGAPLCFVGANNYYASYKPRPMVIDLLRSARAMGVNVLRIWAFIDRGSLDLSVRNIDGEGSKDGVYFQAWDAASQRVTYNDGPTGLIHLDDALAEANELGLKVVLVLTNNWPEFGGMDQYLVWHGLSSHEDFYSAAPVRRTYKDWLAHLVLRVNSRTGTRYRDDPTIFAWELANEPRGIPGTESDVLTSWAAEMSSYLKTLDPNHLVAVGDEGFFEGAGEHWTYHAQNGVDHAQLSALPSIDYSTFHMYPEDWGTGFGWSERWIDDHLSLARKLGKPAVLEEYGLRVTRDATDQITSGEAVRLSTYATWNERVLQNGGSAAFFWLLAGRDSAHGEKYPDFDHFSVYWGDKTSQLLSGFAQRFATEAPACVTSGGRRMGTPSRFVTVR